MAKKSSNSSKKESAPPLRLAKRKPAKALLFALILGAGTIAAYPIAPTPAPIASPTETPSPAPLDANALPFDSNLILVLDDTLSSKSTKSGQFVRAHLRDPIVIGGQTVAAAGAPVQIKVTASSAADIGDVYGFVDIFYEPLPLADGRTLPIRAPVARLSPHRSAGHEQTVAIEDQIEDQVIPYHFLWHIFRSGKNFVLKAGSELPARTEAALSILPNGSVAIQTPQPLVPTTNVPKSTFPVIPVATPFGPAGGQIRRPTPTPLPTPTLTPTPSASPSSSP